MPRPKKQTQTSKTIKQETKHAEPKAKQTIIHQETKQDNGKYNSIPWVEKYRPTSFDDIVLDCWNRRILSSIIERKQFPNLLFYGPPGTGKTTTIINLINTYQRENNQLHKDLVIHLNASDDRGIDVIRNQIQQFVNTKTLFGKGTKFVILDEIDYMTKDAQQALKNVISQQDKNNDVRYCLICNYISRIEKCLQDECMNLRFNQLPKEKVIQFLQTIVEGEKLKIGYNELEYIQNYYKSDIRSMINYLQSNQNMVNTTIRLMDKETIQNIIKYIMNTKNNEQDILLYFHQLSIEYNKDIREIIQHIVYLVMENIDTYCENVEQNENSIIEAFTTILHNENNYSTHYIIYYLVSKLRGSLCNSISK